MKRMHRIEVPIVMTFDVEADGKAEARREVLDALEHGLEFTRSCDAEGEYLMMESWQLGRRRT